jgi:hypothetical protein
VRDAGWPWAAGVGLLRRLERGSAAHRAAALRAIEMPEAKWTPSRRAVAVAYLVALGMQDATAKSAHARAAVHVAFAVALHMFTQRAAGPDDAPPASQRGQVRMARAAQAALTSMNATAAGTREAVEPHRLLVLALLSELVLREESIAAGKLVTTVLQLECARVPEGVDFALSLVDIIALAVSGELDGIDRSWLTLIVRGVGVLPPGVPVYLADGRKAVVLGPGTTGDAFCPLVLVDGKREQASARVHLSQESARAALRLG